MHIDNLIIYLPFPPTVNSYYSAGTGNSRFISAKGNAYLKQVEESIAEQCQSLGINFRMNVEVTLYPHDKRIRDLDNYMKGLLDSCTKSNLWTDDKLIDQLFIFRGETIEGGLAIIEVNRAGPIIKLPKEIRGLLWTGKTPDKRVA